MHIDLYCNLDPAHDPSLQMNNQTPPCLSECGSQPTLTECVLYVIKCLLYSAKKHIWLITSIVWIGSIILSVFSGNNMAAWNSVCCVYFCFVLWIKDTQ